MRTAAAAGLAARWLVALAFAVAGVAAPAQSPELAITLDGKTRTHTVEALLAHPAATTINVPQDIAYKRAMTFRAVPLALLLPGLGREASVRFVASDGFAATIPAALLLAAGDEGARAYLAIEPPTAPWPALKAGSPATAGTFYLVWLRPEKGRITPEQWPYQVARIDAVAPLTTRFPALLPASGIPKGDPIRRGLDVFTTNCIVCHTMNLAGDAKMGPDLNVPFNPTEYLREPFLRRQVRNPASLRHWPDGKMPAFDANTLADRDLDDLIAYLRHMAKRKVPVPTGK